MTLRTYDHDVLARVWHAARYISRREAKRVLNTYGLPSTATDLKAALDAAHEKRALLETEVEGLERERRDLVAAAKEVAGFEQPQWMWCEDAEYDQADRWLLFTGKGWCGVFKAARRDQVPEGCPTVVIDPDWVLVTVEWQGKHVLPQTKADVLEEAVSVAASKLGLED